MITAFGVVAALQARALAEQSRIAGLERDKAEQVVRVLDLLETTNPAVRPDGDRMSIGQFLGGAEARALAQLSGAPLVRAKLQQVFGLIHAERGEFMPARTALEEALAAQRRLVGPDHPDALESLQALGRTMRELGDDESARRLLDESLARHRRVFGDEHDKTAGAMVTVAPLVAATDLDAERALLTQALEIRRHVLPPNDPDLAITLGALAGHHQRRGELERSRELYRQALAVFRDPGERRHPASVTLMGDYASLLSTLKAHDEAEATLREAIAVGEQVLGPGTLTVADLTNNLGVVLAALGRHADAERALRDSYRPSCRAVWGVPLARPQRRAQPRPRPVFAAALPGSVAMDGPCGVDPRVTDSADIGLEGIRAQRAWVVFVVGRSAEALDAASRAVSAIEGMKDPNDGHVLAYSRIVLARILSETGRPDAAEPAARAAAAWFERWGRCHPKFANAECEVGARRCSRAGRRKGGSYSSAACRYIAPGATPTPARFSPSTGCSPIQRRLTAADKGDRGVPDSSVQSNGRRSRPLTRRFDAIPVVTSTYMTDTGVGRSSDWATRIVGLDLELPLLDGRLARYINLDNAATTPPLRDVLDAVLRFLPTTRAFTGARAGSRESARPRTTRRTTPLRVSWAPTPAPTR